MSTALTTATRAGIQTTGPQFSADLFSRFVAYCDVKETTQQGYTVAIRHFMTWLASEGIRQPTREDVQRYKEHLATAASEKGKPFKAGTQARYFRACKLFFKWTASEGLYPNIADNLKSAKIKVSNQHRDALKPADVLAVAKRIDRSTEAGKRNYFIFLLCITCGLRIIEVQRANIEDMEILDGQPVLFIQGKGRDEKDEYKKLIPEVREALDEYLQSRGPYKKSDPLIVGTSNRAKGQRITEPGLSRIVKTLLVQAGYDSTRLTAHSLRHTSVTTFLAAGATLQEAQAHARHADPATTQIYAHNLEREKMQTEQKIYDYIFHPQAKSDREQAAAILDNLSAEKLQQALEYLKKIA